MSIPEPSYAMRLGTDESTKQKWHRNDNSASTLAAFNLACMIYQGKGGPINKLEAAAYFLQAARANHKRAAFNFAYMHFKGDGVPKRYDIAKQFIEPLAMDGDEEAMIILAYIYFKGEK